MWCNQLLIRQNCATSGVALGAIVLPSVEYVPGESELVPNVDDGGTGEEPELMLPLEKGDGAKGEGEKGDEAGLVGGAKGDGSCSACMYGDSADGAGDVSRFRKGGRFSWKASSSSCASQ